MPHRGRRLIASFALLLWACASAPRAERERPSPSATDTPVAPLPCEDLDVYATPEGLAPSTRENRGELVACSRDVVLDREAVSMRLHAAGLRSLEGSRGSRVFRLAYRTMRSGGRGGTSTALVYVPDPMPDRPTIVVAGHATSGLADHCAPSIAPTGIDYLTMPWVARGHVVIAPDYAGLGTEGVMGYGDFTDTAHAMLDAPRAVAALLGRPLGDAPVVMVGHSLGAGSALSAQALAREYGTVGRFDSVIAFAPGWPVDVDVRGFANADTPTRRHDGGPATIGALHVYAWFSNHLGPEHAGDGFAPDARARVVDAIERRCIFPLLSAIPQVAPTTGSLFDPAFREGVVACGTGGPCTGVAARWFEERRSQLVAPDPNGAAILIVQGLRDTFTPPSSAACIVAKLAREGAAPTVCADDSGHLDVPYAMASFATSWADARLRSETPPACPSANTLPDCNAR